MSNDFLNNIVGDGTFIGNTLSGLANSGVGDFVSGLFPGGNPGGSGGGSTPASIANTASDVSSIVDPTTAAQTAIQGPQPAQPPPQSQGPQGAQTGAQGGEQFAPQSAVEQLRKAFQESRMQPRNPYVTGGTPRAGQGGYDPQAVQSDEGPAPRDPTPRPPRFRYLPQPGRPFVKIEPPQAPGEVDELPGTFGGGKWTPPADPRAGPAGEEAVGNALRAKEAGETAVDRALPDKPVPPDYGAGDRVTFKAGEPIPGAGGVGRIAGAGILGDLFPGLAYALHSTPAETGELTPNQIPSTGDEFRPPEAKDPRAGKPGREDSPIDPRTGKPFDPPGTTTAPATGKKVQTVDPKTKKPVDPRTGQPLPTKKGPPGEYQPTPGNARQPEFVPDGRGPIMRDLGGGQGVPPMLGEIARIALPLLLQGLMGGAFGGRRGPGFVGRRWGHPGGFGGRNGGYWPYHHPTFGWGVHGYHPGGGWRPLDPRHMRGVMGGGLGENPLPFSGGDGGGGPLGDTSGGQGASYDPYYDKGSRYRNPGQPSSTVIGKGPDGQALPYTGEQAADFTHEVAEGLGMDSGIAQQILAGESSYGQNYTNNRERDNIPSYGPFQLHDSGPGSVGYAFKQQTGEDPRDPSTWKDQIVFALKWAQKNGWSPWGAATQAGIPQWAGIDRRSNKQFAWNYGQENGGVTATGGSNDPQPPVQVGTAGGLPVMQ